MNPDDPRANRSRQALLEAGVEVLLRNPNASLKEVATFAGVGRATLYRHFKTRDQLILELAKESLILTDRAMIPIKEQDLEGRAALEGMLNAIMPLADRFHFLLSLWNIAENDPDVTAIYTRQLDEIAVLVEQGKRSGDIKRSLTTPWIVTLIDCLIIAGWWMMRSKECTAEEAAHSAIQSLFGGIAT